VVSSPAIVTDGSVESINVSRGGVPKTAVFEALVTGNGIDGDRQRDRRYHGGPDRAIVLYSIEVIDALRHEGHAFAPGAAGENLTLSGIDWNVVTPGVELRIGPLGEVRLAVTQYASPCHKVAPLFVGGDITRISQKIHPGWSRVCARVIAGGIVRVGDVVTLG
jgi:MOSC domain-containing protein YiiM